jgi:hypothetical protein
VFALLALATAIADPAWAEVYKCTDASGKITYSDIACMQPQTPGPATIGGDALHSSAVEQRNPAPRKPCARPRASSALDDLEGCRQQPDSVSSVRR